MSPTSAVDALTGPLAADVIASLALLAALLTVRLLAVRALGSSRLTPEVKGRWLQQIRAASVLLLLAGLIAIWTHEIRELALSVAAIAVAVVISLKELLLCLHGSFLRTSSRAFSVGDRIQAAGVRGDVVETGALTTTLLEVAGSGSKQTGRSVVLPNSVFVAQPIVNETFAGEYGLFALRVPVEPETWPGSEERLLEAARAVCGEHLEGARRHVESVGWQKGLGPDSLEPSVTVELTEPDVLTLQVRFPAPTRVRGQVEQDIVRRYLAGAAGPPAPPAG